MAEQEPDRADYQRDLIVSFVKLAEAEPSGARGYLTRALQIAEALERSGRLNPVDAWIPDELRRRLGELE